jgi:hypothetical protein
MFGLGLLVICLGELFISWLLEEQINYESLIDKINKLLEYSINCKVISRNRIYTEGKYFESSSRCIRGLLDEAIRLSEKVIKGKKGPNARHVLILESLFEALEKCNLCSSENGNGLEQKLCPVSRLMEKIKKILRGEIVG